jgi:hypothetical protein
MITCCVEYDVSPAKLAEFERYAKLWIELVPRFGGTHHGYFLPHEGGDYVAYALFSFPSLADYEVYRAKMVNDPDCQAAMAYYRDTKCFLRHDRSFLRPLLESDSGTPPKPNAA